MEKSFPCSHHPVGHGKLLVIPLTKSTPGDALSLKEIGVDDLPDSVLNRSVCVSSRYEDNLSPYSSISPHLL